LEYVGRVDEQVKLRGFRIELGEIETVLSGHAAVRECVVVVRGESEAKRLVAYVVGEADEEMKVSELRDHLRAKLPEYMVPSAFVVLEELPLTVNGKVDRRALPEPAADESGYVAPRTAVEEMIAGIWESLLPVERVGIHDNFFDLGGHSLLATQVASRVREAFQVEVPLRTFFECPTVAALTLAIVRSLVEQEDRAEVVRLVEELEHTPDRADAAQIG
jgi:acyl carrier protein